MRTLRKQVAEHEQQLLHLAGPMAVERALAAHLALLEFLIKAGHGSVTFHAKDRMVAGKVDERALKNLPALDTKEEDQRTA